MLGEESLSGGRNIGDALRMSAPCRAHKKKRPPKGPQSLLDVSALQLIR
jgi:hypothetical protein